MPSLDEWEEASLYLSEQIVKFRDRYNLSDSDLAVMLSAVADRYVRRAFQKGAVSKTDEDDGAPVAVFGDEETSPKPVKESVEPESQLTVTGSSNINSASYDKVKGHLDVTFSNGKRYRYFGVPVEVYQAMRDTASAGKSVGRFVSRHIRNKYKFAEVA